MTSIDPAILNALDDLLPLAGFPTLRDDVADRLAPLLVDKHALTAALAERDAARAEVTRLRAEVRALRRMPLDATVVGRCPEHALTYCEPCGWVAATEDQP